jgi:PAS domain S-box-containing protein
MENFYKSALEKLPIGYAYHKIILDDSGKPVDFEFIEANPSFRDMTGLTQGDIIGKRGAEIVPDIKDGAFDLIGYYGEIALNGGERNFEQYAEPLKRWYNISVFSPEKYYFITIFTDITERKLSEQEKLALAKFPSENPNPVLRLTTDGTVLFSNPACENLIDIRDGRVIYSEWFNKIKECMNTGRPAILEQKLKKKFYSFTFAPITENDYVNVYGVDITVLKQTMEKLTGKNKELENYIYIASHDLRSPLVNIQGFSQRLQSHIESIKDIFLKRSYPREIKEEMAKLTDEDIPKSLEYIFSGISRMERLINGLLQVSRTEKFKMVVHKVGMNELIRNIVHALAFQVEQAGGKVKIDDLPDCYGDAELLTQLFANIILNALKYRHLERAVLINISSKIDSNEVEYIIRDNGIGMHKKYLDKIWDIFYRVDSKYPEAGDGIGLSMVKRIAGKHQGKVWVESEEGTGSVFHVLLKNHEFSE